MRCKSVAKTELIKSLHLNQSNAHPYYYGCAFFMLYAKMLRMYFFMICLSYHPESEIQEYNISSVYRLCNKSTGDLDDYSCAV